MIQEFVTRHPAVTPNMPALPMAIEVQGPFVYVFIFAGVFQTNIISCSEKQSTSHNWKTPGVS